MEIHEQHERVAVTHRCSHRHERALQSYHPHKRTWEPILKLAHTRPPLAVQLAHDKKVNTAKRKALQYWQEQLCSDCWRNEKDGKRTPDDILWDNIISHAMKN